MVPSLSPSRDDAAALLDSLQLADSFFPSGLYALSHGLESFAQEFQVGPGNLESLLADYLRYGFGATDGVALVCAHRAVEERDLRLALEADLRLTAAKLAREARETSTRTGRQLLRVARSFAASATLDAYAGSVMGGEAPGNHAVVLGITMAGLGIPREAAITGALYSLVSGCVAATVRLSLIDHLFAQITLHRLKPVIAEVASADRDKGVQDIAGTVPRIDIMAMRHERAEVRLFMS